MSEPCVEHGWRMTGGDTVRFERVDCPYCRAERAESALAEMEKCYSDVESERQETVKQLLKAKRERAELYDLASTLTGEATEFWSIKAQVLCQKINDCAARAAGEEEKT